MDFVAGYVMSHAGLIVSRKDLGPDEPVTRIYDAFAVIRDEIAGLKPDAILIIATDHMKAFPLEGVPQFSLGVGAVAHGLGDAGLPPCEVPVHQPFAQAILDGTVARGVDLAFTEHVAIDHSYVVPLSLITPGLDVPIIPLTQNCNVPPRPTLRRSYEVGRALGEAARAGPPGRVVLVGTGGLSHWVGSEDRRSFVNRPAGTRIADRDLYPVEIEETGDINVTWDLEFLATLGRADVSRFLDEWTAEQVEAAAGNGAHEIRNWLTAIGAIGDRPVETVAYEPISEWLTGTAVARFAA
jgi:hypothetical protein